GTFAIIDASEPSDLHYVIIEGGKGASAGGKSFKGSITFSGSPGSITNVTISGAQGESALSLSQMFVDVRDSTITGSAHGGIIIESALAGRMEDVTVTKSSGHGIDLRGSPLALRHIVVEESTAACIRSAERSAPLIEDSRFEGCEIGILSEEGGHIVAKNVTLVGNQVGFSAKGGSPAFGPGSIVANGTVFVDNMEASKEEGGGIVAVD
ncbi:MAG: right-handed parallel beta-helix repeat-containing protein, partial [Patescibacteria group bacterium]